MNFIVLVLIPVLPIHGYWEIKWMDHFNNDSLDLSKWDVTNEVLSCDGNSIQQFNCKTNNSRNLWLLDGTLSIAAVAERHKYLEKDYTSAMITTKEGFTFGRFEIRAALPKGKMLRPAIYFIPTKETGQWPKDGQIDFMTNIQTQSLGNGIHVVRQYNQYIGKEYKTKEDLKQFHSYILEWNETTIIWKFDEIQHQTIDLTKELANFSNPFTHPFKIVITLGVGGVFFNDLLTKEDVEDWDCSLLILDYVKIYEWIDGTLNKNISDSDKRVSGADTICETIMPFIRLPKKMSFPFTPVISVMSLILLLVLIPFVIYVFLRQKKQRNINRNNELEYYEDTQQYETQQENYYEETKDDEYEDPYQRPNSNHYTSDTPPKRSSKDYIQMTNKYVRN